MSAVRPRVPSRSGSAGGVPAARKPQSKEEAIQRVSAAASSLSKAEAVELALQLEASLLLGRDVPEVSALTGEALPPAGEILAARRRNLVRAFAERHVLLADSLDAGEVARLLGVTRQTPHDRFAAGALLAVKDQGQRRFPSWQFDAEASDGTLPGLQPTLRALRGPISELGRVRWFLTPKDALDGRTPLEVLRSGEVAPVVRAAEALGAS